VAWGPTQTQWVLAYCSPGIKQLRHQTDSLSSGVKVRNVWPYTFMIPHTIMVWCLIKHWVYFTFSYTSNKNQGYNSLMRWTNKHSINTCENCTTNIMAQALHSCYTKNYNLPCGFPITCDTMYQPPKTDLSSSYPFCCHLLSCKKKKH
jgi:hypothetical protein